MVENWFLRKFLAVLLGVWGSLGVAQHLPPYFKVADNALDYLLLVVNEKARLVKAGGELVIVEGDSLRIEAARLQGGRVPENINLVGFRSANNLRPQDDKGALVDTGQDLKRGWSLRGSGEYYKIEVSSGTTFHGLIRIRLLKPELRYIVFSINGGEVIVRAQDHLKVSSLDNIKVKRVVTNLTQTTDKTRFEVLAKRQEGRARRYVMRFKWRDRTLAEIPVTVD